MVNLRPLKIARGLIFSDYGGTWRTALKMISWWLVRLVYPYCAQCGVRTDSGGRCCYSCQMDNIEAFLYSCDRCEKRCEPDELIEVAKDWPYYETESSLCYDCWVTTMVEKVT